MLPRLPNPWVVLGVLAVLIAVWWYRGVSVSGARDTYWKGQIAEANAKAQAEKNAADGKVRDAEQKAASDVNAVATQLNKALGDLDAANSTIANLRRAAVTGQRVSIAVRRDSVCGGGSVPSTAPATGDSSTVYAELPPATVLAIADIARDANADALRHNACVDAYNSVRQRVEELINASHRVSQVHGQDSATAAAPAP